MLYYTQTMIDSEIGAIMSAPNQNHENFAQRTERLIPFFGARVLSRLISLESGKPLPQIDMWNSFGHLMDEAFKSQTRFDGASREEYAGLLLDEKYAYFASIGIDTGEREIIRDDAPETQAWVQEKIQKLYDNGTIYEDDEALQICASCRNIISVASVVVGSCSRCKSQDIRIKKRPSLFIDLTGDRQKYIQGKVLLPKNAGHINGQFATLPGRVLIERQRDYGQSLAFLGRDDMVLDPKIGLGLLPEMVSERFGLQAITQIQGAPTAKNTVPYTSLLSPDLDAKYIFTNHAPKNITTETIDTIGVDFFTKYLPLFMLDKTGDVSEVQLQALIVEHSKAKRKLDNALLFIRSNEGVEVPLPPKDEQLIADSLRDIASSEKIRNSVMNMRKYIFEGIGKRYTDAARIDNEKLNEDDLQAVEKTLREIF